MQYDFPQFRNPKLSDAKWKPAQQYLHTLKEDPNHEKEDTKDGLSPMLVKQVLKATQEAGVLVGRGQVEWALNRVIGGSTAEPADAATKMILAQPAARRALASLRAAG